MPAIKRLTGRAASLGKVVELREMTVGQWKKHRKSQSDDMNPLDASLTMLGEMLYVDGAPIGAKLDDIGFGEMQEAMAAMNEMLGIGEEGND